MKLMRLFLIATMLTAAGNLSAMDDNRSYSNDEKTIKDNATSQLIDLLRNPRYIITSSDIKILISAAERVTHLLAQGANPNGDEDSRPLILAAIDGYYPHLSDTSIVKLLLAHRADPNLPDSSRNTTPLIQASGFHVTNILLAHRANPNRVDNLGHSALGRALGRRDFDTVQLLLDHNANPDLALPWAAGLGSITCMAYLLSKGAQPDCTNNVGDTPLLLSVYHGNNEVVRTLLQAGANPLQQDTKGKSALMIAQEKLDEADTDEKQATYLAIIEMLTNPQNIRRTGFNKIA